MRNLKQTILKNTGLFATAVALVILIPAVITCVLTVKLVLEDQRMHYVSPFDDRSSNVCSLYDELDEVNTTTDCYIKQAEDSDEEQLPQYGSFPYQLGYQATPEEFIERTKNWSIDEGYGIQCVALFKQWTYQQKGVVYATPTGGASGYAGYRRLIDAGFEWHTDRNLRNGDWVIYGYGQYGHVAMYYNGKLWGQNQNSANIYVGSKASFMPYSDYGFLGYFRDISFGAPIVATPAPESPLNDPYFNVINRFGTLGYLDPKYWHSCPGGFTSCEWIGLQ